MAAIKNIGVINGGGEGGTVNVDLTNVEKALDAILKAIENVNGTLNNMDNGLKDAINNLTDLLNAFMKQEFAMGEKTQELIEAFMAKFSEFVTSEQANDAEMYDLVSKLAVTVQEFMKQEANMDAEEKELAQKILNAINNLTLGGSGGDVTVNVDLSKLEAMMQILVDKVGNLEGGVAKLIELALAGNENIGNLIKVVQAFKDDTKADLNDIKELLKAVKDGVDNNGKALLENNEKLDIVILTLKELKDQYPDLNAKLDEVIAKLGEILAKIPEGCDCNVDQILVKLDLIITELQKNPGNEGIVDDLDDLLQ